MAFPDCWRRPLDTEVAQRAASDSFLELSLAHEKAKTATSVSRMDLDLARGCLRNLGDSKMKDPMLEFRGDFFSVDLFGEANAASKFSECAFTSVDDRVFGKRGCSARGAHMQFIFEQFDLQAVACDSRQIEKQAEAVLIFDDIQRGSVGHLRRLFAGCVAAAFLVEDVLDDVFHFAREILQSGGQLTNLERKRSHSVTPSRFKGLDPGARQSSVIVTAPEFDGKT